MIGKELEFAQFVIALSDLDSGYRTGHFNGRRYGVTVERQVGARVIKLFAEELGGSNVVSFNLFSVGDGQSLLKPCEMNSEKVIDFVLGFIPQKRPTTDAVATK